MTKDQQEAFYDRYVAELRDILLNKGDDYANADRLSNFKQAGAMAGISAKQNCLSLIATKVSRIGNLIATDNIVKNESVQDSVKDLINYGVLLAMILEEEQHAK